MNLPRWNRPGPVVMAFLLTAATLACLVPFITRAFHIDDPLFIWTARQIQTHPFDFYGFKVNWEGVSAPMSGVTQNPPLAAYYLALVGFLLGWSELALHAGFLLPAIAAVIGTFYLGRQFCSHPGWAALAVLTAPLFVLSSTGVMCDTMMLAFWVWALYFWITGLREENRARLLLSALLIAACGLTKYFGLSLIPLLLVYSWLGKHPVRQWLPWLLVPMIILGIYQWWTYELYGKNLLLNAAAFAAQRHANGDWSSNLLTTLAFTGGGIVLVAAAAPLLWGARQMTGVPLAMALIGLLAILTKKVGMFDVVVDGRVAWPFVVQLALFAVAGMSLAFLALADVRERKSRESVLLLLWMTGTLVFTGGLNWTISGRNLLPMLPAVSFLVIRRLEDRTRLNGRNGMRWLWAPLFVSLVLALVVTRADCRLANSARAAVGRIREQAGRDVRVLWFEGHWGFQYYMEELGGSPLDRTDLRLEPGQAVVVPMANCHLFPLPADHLTPWLDFTMEVSSWVSTMEISSGAGFYSDVWGPLPFAFGPVPAQHYLVFRVR